MSRGRRTLWRQKQSGALEIETETRHWVPVPRGAKAQLGTDDRRPNTSDKNQEREAEAPADGQKTHRTADRTQVHR
jgi:hypothetical protein